MNFAQFTKMKTENHPMGAHTYSMAIFNILEPKPT